jgi:hypothetical protein
MREKDPCHLAGALLCRFALARHRTAATEELVNGRIPLEGSYLAAFREQPDRPLGKRFPNPRLDRGACLILILFLSLGLWATIWKLASAVLR